MKIGQARCIGSDLTIHLSGPASSNGASGETLLDRIELIYLDQLTIPLPANPPTADDGNEQQTGRPTDRGIVSINCDGRLEYDFAIDQLTLHDSVSFVHQISSKSADEFRCDLMKVRFNDPTSTDKKREGPLDWLVEIVATGSPAALRAPSYDTDLFADQIRFHAVKGLLEARGATGVQFRRGGISMRLANLVYQFDPKRPKMLGAIDVQGAGIVELRDPKIPLRKVQWRDQFKMFPVSATTASEINSDVELQVDGDFHAWFTDGGEVQADSIAGVLKPERKSESDDATTLVPDRLISHGNVRIDTAAVSVTTQRLFVQFVAEPNPVPVDSQPVDQKSKSSLRQWVTQPAGDQTLTAPVARNRPIIRGDSINVQLRRNETGLSVKKLKLEGSVQATHHLSTGGQMMPVRITGELLQMEDSGGQDVLEIVGGTNAPARFEMGDGFFIGPKIQIRPGDNMVWINAAGEFRIPSSAMPAGLAAGMTRGLPAGSTAQPNQNVQWTQPPHCRWKGEMRFDGRTALLTGGVEITASLINDREPWEFGMRGDRLRVDLVEEVQMGDSKTMRNATVREISLLQASDHPVLVHAIQRAADGVTESKHMINASKLTFSPASGGGLVGEGPGWYRGWFIPQSGQGMPGASVQLQHASDGQQLASNESSLTGVHLVFGNSMRGDLSARTLDFLKGVRVGIRPVPSWDESFDAMTMDAISTGESTLDCDQLRFAIEPGFLQSDRTAGVPMPWEVAATSGVVFRTRTERGLIEGTASRAVYASGKQLFTADGAPNRPAIVRQTRADGSRGFEQAVRTITIQTGTMTILNSELEWIRSATP